MRWRKLGKVFDPASCMPPGEGGLFAQSPQALCFDDFTRIYYSTRSLEKDTGKYLSHIAFADFTPDLTSIIRVSGGAVIPLGGLGCFDEHGIFPMNVLRVGNEIYGYTCGWNRRVSVSVDTAIGLAISRDGGLTFQRTGDGPVLASSPREPFLVGDPFVKVVDGVFHMWYIFGTSWRRRSQDEQPERTYKIGHAVSSDGIAWSCGEGRQIIENCIGEEESQALPTVVRFQGRYHMFFCYRHTFGFRDDPKRGYRIGHAWSDDLAAWRRDDQDPHLEGTPGDWDSDMQCYPNAFERDGRVFMLYNGNEFGRFGFGAAILEA